MKNALRLTAIFVVLYINAGIVVWFGLPKLVEWHFAHCQEDALSLCSVSAPLLNYWWLAIFPVLVVATVLINLGLTRRRAV